MSQLTLRHGLVLEGNNPTSFGGITSVTNTTDSVSPVSGAFTVSGGAGIAKSLSVGTGLEVRGPSTFPIIPLNQSVILNPLSTGDTGIEIVATNSSGLSYIDFGYSTVDFRGRIIYSNTNDTFIFNTAGSDVTPKLTLDASGNITTPAYISANVFTTGNNVSPIGTDAHFRFSGSTTSNNIIIEAGATADGGNIGLSNINFNGYFDTTDQRINSGKNRWRISVNQNASNDLFNIDTYNGTLLSTIIQLNTSLSTIFPTTTASTSSSIGSVLLSGGLSISNTTDASSSTNGGTFTTAGGASIAKNLFVGGTPTFLSSFITRAGTSSSPGTAHYNLQTSSLNRISMGLVSTEAGSNTGSDFTLLRYDDSGSLLDNILTVTRSTGSINIKNSIVSSSSTVGALTLLGGISINNTTDAVSLTNGGTFTTAGGISVAKKIFVGDVGSFSNTINMNNTKIINLDDPTSILDAANKKYVDNVAQGLSVKESVAVATITPGTLTTDFENGDTIDGVTLVTGDRILIKNQTTGIENGIYIVQPSGVPLRSDDFASGSSQGGSFVFIQKGTVNADSGWVVTNDSPNDVVGTNALTFTQFSGAGSIDAGTGLNKSGSTLNVNANLPHVIEVGTLISLTVDPGTISGVSLNLSGLTASQAVHTDGSKNLISVATTGSGNSVLQTTPTLITPNIGAATATSITVSGGTWTSTTNNIILSANGSNILLRNTIGSANGEFESSTTIFKFRNSTNTANILEINKSTSLSTFTGIIDSTNTTSSTSSITGALTLAGGIGISNTTDATSSTNGGSFTTAGGISVGKKLYVGGPLVNLTSATNPNFEITDGSFVTNWGLATTGGTFSTSSIAGDTVIRSAATRSLILQSGTGSSALTITSGNIINILGTTASTSTTTGALTLAGGIGISNTTDATSSSNGGSFTTAGGVSIAKKIISGSSITGASLATGENFSPFGSAHFRKADYPTINNIIIEGGSTSDFNPLNVGFSSINFNGYFFNGEQRINTAKNRWRLGVDQRNLIDYIFLDTYDGTTLTSIFTASPDGRVDISQITATTSSNTGSLTSQGGIGINNATDAVSVTNGGSLTTAGGVAIAKKLYVGGILTGTTSIFSSISVSAGAGGLFTGLTVNNDNVNFGSASGITVQNGTLKSVRLYEDNIDGTTNSFKIDLTSNTTTYNSAINILNNNGTIFCGINNLTPLFTLDVTGSGNFSSNVDSLVQVRNHNPNTGTNAYTVFILSNSSGVCSLFLNSSGRSTDGGVNTATLRNDVGSLRFQNASQASTITLTGATTTFSNNVSLSGTTASTSNTTGILTSAGGIGISNTTDATSSTNGGTFTSAGGAAIAKNLYIGSSIIPGSYSGTTTSTFTGVTSYDVPINLTNFQSIDIIIRQYYDTAGADVLLTYSGTNFSEYANIFTKFTDPLVPVADTTNILFDTIESGVNDSYTKITVTRSSITNGRNTVNIRGSYCWAGVGQTRVDGTGFTLTAITSIRIAVTTGTMTGSYTIFNYV